MRFLPPAVPPITEHLPVGCAHSLSHAHLCVTPWTAACQAPLSVGLSRQGYWSRLPFPSPGDLPDPGIEPTFLTSPALAGGFLTTSDGSQIILAPEVLEGHRWTSNIPGPPGA